MALPEFKFQERKKCRSPNIIIDEVEDWKWVNLSFLELDLDKNPDIYTEWFKIIFNRVKGYMETLN